MCLAIMLEALKLIEVKLLVKLGEPETAILHLESAYLNRGMQLIQLNFMKHGWALRKRLKVMLRLSLFKLENFDAQLGLLKCDDSAHPLIEHQKEKAMTQLWNHLASVTHMDIEVTSSKSLLKVLATCL